MKILFNGETVDVPESEVDWFVNEKGAKLIEDAPKKRPAKAKTNTQAK